MKYEPNTVPNPFSIGVWISIASNLPIGETCKALQSTMCYDSVWVKWGMLVWMSVTLHWLTQSRPPHLRLRHICDTHTGTQQHLCFHGHCNWHGWKPRQRSNLYLGNWLSLRVFGVKNLTIPCTNNSDPTHTDQAQVADDRPEPLSLSSTDNDLGCSIRQTWS